MNKITVLGRLTKDPDVRYTPSQKVVCSFTLAVPREFRNPETNERETDFIPVVVWGKTAELCGNSLAKGHRLLVEGRLQIREFTGKDGQRRWITEIIARSVEFIERKADVTATENIPTSASVSTSKPASTSAPAPVPAPAPAPKETPAYTSTGKYTPASKPAPAAQVQRGTYHSKGSYTKQAAAPQQARYTPAGQQVQPSYQRQTVASPFDEEVPF